MNKRKTSLFFFILSILFFYLPLIILVIYSFNEGRASSWENFSFKWYKELFFHSDKIWTSFKYSLMIGLLSSFVSTTIGTLGALAIHWYNFKHKKYLKIISFLPLVIPDIILAVSFLVMFSTIKIKFGLTTIFIAHTTINIPFVIFIILSRLGELDFSIVEAAYDLGATESQTLKKIILPMLVPAIISSFLMAFTLSLDDYVTTSFVVGPGSSTLPLRIYSMVRHGISPVVNALSVLLIVISITLTISTKHLQKYFVK